MHNQLHPPFEILESSMPAITLSIVLRLENNWFKLKNTLFEMKLWFQFQDDTFSECIHMLLLHDTLRLATL